MPGGTAPAPSAQELASIGVLVERMDEAGITRAELARRIDRSAAQVSDMLNGKKSMRWADFDAICVALGLRTSEVTALGKVRAAKKLAEADAEG